MKSKAAEPSLVETEREIEPRGPRHLTESQARALGQLTALAQLSGHHQSYGGVVCRARPLIIGPSGCGKTAVVLRLCDTLGARHEQYPLLQVNCGSWIVYSAKANPYTLDVIHDFVRKNEHGCILLDEIDKSTAVASGFTQSWDLSVFTELLALLDGDGRLRMCGWSDSDIAHLSRHFFIIGAGAWQHHAKASADKPSYEEKIQGEAGIPEELAFRFNARFIELSLPSRKDFAGQIRRIYEELELPQPDPTLLEKMLDAALASRRGSRWTEQLLSDLLCAHPTKLKACAPVSPYRPSTPQASPEIIAKAQENLYRLMDGVEPAITLFRVQFRIIAKRLNLASDGSGFEFSSEKSFTAVDLDDVLKELITGLHFRYATDDTCRKAREAALWKAAHIILPFFNHLLEKETALLSEHRLIPLVALTSSKLSRALSAWTYTASLFPPEKPEETA